MSKLKTINKIVEREFDRQGIANFTNKGGENKVTWKSRVTREYPGVYNTHSNGAPAQMPIQGMIARPGDFSQLTKKYGADPNTFRGDNGQPFQMPRGADNSFEGLAPTAPVKVGQHRPRDLMEKTEVIRHPEGDPSFSQAEINSVLEHS